MSEIGKKHDIRKKSKLWFPIIPIICFNKVPENLEMGKQYAKDRKGMGKGGLVGLKKVQEFHEEILEF